ncbi:hypothetical protein B0681_07695 [Moraxella porci DSM 25326]|uniref:TOTE conflict systems S1/CSD-like domain-containing protein n=1 Tax=Moraxella porci DSM 25326 TaxID=573983 RepID=A0A1T0CQF5_9GAMM|nr:hypothetical protein [Moraxella porci]OOS24381.1 hypothetical protein B0681_07695 [Moraxella porci DSM 25326]
MAENFQSEFVFGLQGRCYQDFVDTVASHIIEQIIKTDDYEIIGFDKHLSFVDFDHKHRKQSVFPEFYLNFLADITKDANGVSFKKKVCITLDERLCNDICPSTGRKITAIKLAGVDLAYFIYFDVKEFFDFAYSRKNNNKCHQLKESSLPQNKNQDVQGVVQTKLTMTVDSCSEYTDDPIVEKIGYIHNHHYGFAYIRTSVDRKDVFRIPHDIFPEIKELPVGTVIKSRCKINENDQVYHIESFEECSSKELGISFEQFEGKLERGFGKNFAFIKDNNASIYVPSSWAKYFNEGQTYNVQCLAVESYNNNGDLGWEALDIIVF